MREQTIQLHYLGKRNYLQGGTMLDRLIPFLADGRHIVLSMNRMIASDRILVQFGRQHNVNPKDGHASMSYEQSGDKMLLSISELEPSPNPCSVPYDETHVVAPAILNGDSITGPVSGDNTWIMTGIALHKVLLARLLEPPQPGKWLFTRLELEYLPAQPSRVELRFQKRFRFAAVVSELLVDDEPLGTMTFSWRPQ